MFEVDDFFREVDGDGIHADDGEEGGPAFELPDVDDEVEEGKEQQAEAADEADEGTGPQVFIDGEGEVPEGAGADEGNGAGGHEENLAERLAAQIRRQDELAGEHAE